jgi:hypothetical protein
MIPINILVLPVPDAPDMSVYWPSKVNTLLVNVLKFFKINCIFLIIYSEVINSKVFIGLNLYIKMIFQAQTKYSNRLKSLFELLFNNMSTACFTIDDLGIHLKTQTTQNILLEVNLEAELFDTYIMSSPEPIHIGLGSYINQSFKTIKNKSMVEFSIETPERLTITITSDADDCEFKLSTATENVQNVSMIPHCVYNVVATKIPTSRFSSMCRLFKENPFFTVTKDKGLLQFKSGVDEIYTKHFQFGKENVTDTSLVHDVYKSDQFSRIAKIVSFCSDANKLLDISAEEKKPLMIHAICEIGSLKAYIFPTDGE